MGLGAVGWGMRLFRNRLAQVGKQARWCRVEMSNQSKTSTVVRELPSDQSYQLFEYTLYATSLPDSEPMGVAPVSHPPHQTR